MTQTQMGLFFDESTVQIALCESSSWKAPKFNLTEYQELITSARANLYSIDKLLYPYFQLSLDATIQSLAQVTNDPGQSDLWRAVAQLDDRAWTDLNVLVSVSISAGIEYKVRASPRSKIIGVYVENVGSIIVNGLNAVRYWSEFLPWRSCFFRASFRDDVLILSVPSARWEHSVCCNHFASAGERVPPVPTVRLCGREYVVTSAVYTREYREAEAWCFVRQCDWTASSQTYAQILKEMEAGRRERGDLRGTLAKVRGELCVLSEMVVLTDESLM